MKDNNLSREMKMLHVCKFFFVFYISSHVLIPIDQKCSLRFSVYSFLRWEKHQFLFSSTSTITAVFFMKVRFIHGIISMAYYPAHPTTVRETDKFLVHLSSKNPNIFIIVGQDPLSADIHSLKKLIE